MHHPYSDAEEMGIVTLRCYSLGGITVEKLRAVLGQRKHAIARDLYDIASIRDGVDHTVVRRILPTKLAAKDLDLSTLSPDTLRAREAEFRADWDRSLLRLVPEAAALAFDDVWSRVLQVVERCLQPA